MGRYSVPSPALETLDDSREPFHLLTRGGELDLDAYDRLERTRTHYVPEPRYQQALELYDELQERSKGYVDRARSRDAQAKYLLTVAHEHPHRAREMERLSAALRDAREFGLWQVAERFVLGEDGDVLIEDALKCEWFNRADLVKLCPDDARAEGMRVASIYMPRIDALQRAGYEVHYAVATFPNSPAGFLAADLRAIKARVRDGLLYAKTDGRKPARSTRENGRIFGTLKGVLCTVEAPLSARGDWNVHANLLMVFSDRPDYGAIREAWGANIELRPVKTGAVAATMRELIKYPLQAVSFKSDQKTEHGRRRWDPRRREYVDIGPPMIEWPTDAFLEWWDAHKRYRRTCAWGELFGRLEEPSSPWVSRDSVETLGRMFLSPSRFRADRPLMPALVAWDELKADREARQREVDRRQADFLAGLSDEQRDLFFAEQRERERVRELQRALDRSILDAWACGDDPALGVDLILGNNSAKNPSDDGARGPPDTS